MCGLVWVSGKESNRQAVPALQRMDYRGYDSFGFACLTDVGIEVQRSLECLREVETNLPSSHMVLGHTRWATHGSVSLANCHPHFDSRGRFALAHNGIVSNAQMISDQADLGWSQFDDDSDTLLIAQRLGQLLDENMPPKEAFLSVVSQMHGRNTLVCMFATGEVMAFRLGSPLLLMQLENGALALASDAFAFSDNVVACSPLEERECLLISGAKLEKFACQQPEIFHEGSSSSPVNLDDVWLEVSEEISWVDVQREFDTSATPKQGRHKSIAGEYMRAEILEQWSTIPLQVRDAACAAELLELILAKRCLMVTGAGGAGIVADQIARMLQAQTDRCVISASVCEIDRFESFAAQACLLAISQSGETADTIKAIERAKALGMTVISLVNMPFSSMGRLSDLCIDLGAGPEQCVLSTKTATAQIAFGYWLAGEIQQGEVSRVGSLQQLGIELSQNLVGAFFEAFNPAVDYLEHQSSVYLLGRGMNYAAACLGALNLKEATYIHAEAFSAGELKHGVIALIEPGTPVVLFGLKGDPYMLNVASELKARGATILAVGSSDGDIQIPDVGQGHPVATPICCQILAYQLAKRRGINPDRPRNLAKSVTVL